jgi:hypothetical protein
MKTAYERQQEKREAKLAEMQEQIKAGTLVVRKMTDEERAQLPPPRPAKRKPRY